MRKIPFVRIKPLCEKIPPRPTREIPVGQDMWQAMQEVGYKENTKVLTRAQVRTIVQFLGKP